MHAVAVQKATGSNIEDQSTVYPPDSASSEEKEIGCISEEPLFVNGLDCAVEEKQIDVQLDDEPEKQIMELTDLPAEDPVPQEEEVPLQKEKAASLPSSESVEVVLKEETAASLPSTSMESSDELSSLSNEKSSPPDVSTTSDDGIGIVPDLDLDASGWTKVTGDGLLGIPPATEQSVSASVAPPVRTLHTFYMVRIPRPIDTMDRSEIKMAELNLKERTEKRDFLNAALQMKWASKHEVVERLKAAREKERTIREALREKRKETDPLHAALKKVKGASRYAREKGQDLCTSEKELDDRIASMENRMAHNSIPLQEEKQLIREIRQLNASREQVRANAPVHAEVQETLGQKDDIQARLKPLAAEVDLLRKDQQAAFSKIAVIEEECNVLDEAISQLMKERDAATNARQKAFVSRQILYNTKNSRNDLFYQNRDEILIAKRHASQNDKKAVEEICNAQMERILSLWIGNADFRAEYVKNNERSTLKRLETLDGRALGPDEEPPLLISMNESVAAMPDNRVGSVPSEKAQLANTDIPNEKVRVQQVTNELKAPPLVKLANGKLPRQKAAEPEPTPVVSAVDANDIPALPASKSESISEDDKVKEELEAAQLKERRRQQEMAKAKEAEERKRRQAERTRAKALARAEKEAERKEKEKEKRARKKAASTAVAVGSSGDKRVEEESITEAQAGKVEASVEIASPSSEDKVSSRRRKKPVPQRSRASKAPLVHLSTKRSTWPFQIWLLIAAAVILIFIASLLLYLRSS
ncbi:hypothetical protein O6H91_02G029200 [Diphasiastrum complanatum]|nr:hypothetical protein O6H91_02G029200 [Diphasiastrum complanatum]